MIPHAARARLRALRNAIAILEANPDFAGAMVQIGEQSDKVAESISDESKRLGTPARMQHVLKMLDICGNAYLQLVSDLETQKAFEIILDEYRRRSWEQYIGYEFEVAPPIGHAAGPLNERVRHWTIQGYKRLKMLRATPVSNEPPIESESVAPVNKRKQVIMPLLEKRGWSILDWANESDVSHATAMDYLENKTHPYPSTMLKLAKSLGVPVERLPK